MKVAFSIFLLPDRRWHWVMRLWEHGPDKTCTVYAAKSSVATAADAFREVDREYSLRNQPQAAS